MIRTDLNIVQANLGTMRFGAANADHALERALVNGAVSPEVLTKLATARTFVETARRQVDEALEVVHELKNGDYEL